MLDFGKVPPWGHCFVQARVITPGKLAGKATGKRASLTDYRCRVGMPALDSHGGCEKRGPFSFCNANRGPLGSIQ